MANTFALGIAISEGESSEAALTIVEREEEGEPSFVVHETTVAPFDGDVEALASDVQGRLAEEPYTARSSVVVRVDNDEGDALAQALRSRGVRPVRARVRAADEGAEPEADDEVVVDAHAELFALSNAHRGGTLRMGHHSTEDATRLARMLGHLIDDGNEGSEIRADYLGAQGLSALIAYWWSNEQKADPTERLRADLPGTESSDIAA